jgi:thiol-disulfide isomerase/thioredoxin
MRWLIVLAALLAFSNLHAAPASRQIANFRLTDSAGKIWTLDDLKDAKAVVVVFIGTQCPLNNAYMPRLLEIQSEYAKKEVRFVAINANEHDSAATIALHARKFGLTFPVLRDDKQLVADRFGAERTPEVFVLDAERAVRYRGRIDDQYGIGYQRPAPTRRDLAEALDDVLSGKPVRLPVVPATGCLLTRAPRPKANATVTYAREVAPLVQKHCQECHRPGQIGPMALLNYADVSAWAQMIREVIEEKRMPPWHAAARHGHFRNDRSLSDTERATLLSWIDQGCARGDDRDLPPPRRFKEGWAIGTPDAIFTMPGKYTVLPKAVNGVVPYKHFVVPTNFQEDRWIQAVEAKPGNNAIVHHIIVYIIKDGKRVKDKADGIGSGMLVAYAPGDLGVTFPPGAAKKIPKGAMLAFQMHYTPIGTAQTDQSSVGMIFAKEPPAHEVRTRAIAQQLLFIPPATDNYRAYSTSTFNKDVMLFSLFPHMHLRGKSFEFQAVYPDGKKEVLLSVPRYDFGWQSNYHLAQPLRLPAGTRIECTACFDNSSKNANNPDASRWVHWGEQTWEEMMIGFVDYSYLE